MKTRTVSEISHELVRISDGDATYLGFTVANANNTRAAKQFAERTQSEGWIVRDGGVSNWQSEGFVEHDGRIYLYGPYFPGRTVQEVLSQSKGGVGYILQLARSFAVLKNQKVPLPPFQSNAILFLDDGGVLIFPPAVMERIRGSQTEPERIKTYELYNHPDLAGEAGLSFSIAVLVYRMLTGEHPFHATADEDIHHRMREMPVIEPRLVNPEIKPEVSQAVQESLKAESEQRLALETWVERLEEWNRSGFTEQVSEDRKREILELGKKTRERAEKRFATRQYFRRNWRVLAVTGAVALLVGSLVFSILSNALAPPVTVGMEPREVVELYYTSITELDHDAIEDCVTDGAGKATVTEATNLYVLSRMRLGQEGTTGFVPAQQWKDADQPDLEPQYHVYGIADLDIRKLDTAAFVATYEKWEQATEETRYDVLPGSNSVAYERTERLYLRKLEKHENWAIYQIDRIDERILEPDDLS